MMQNQVLKPIPEVSVNKKKWYWLFQCEIAIADKVLMTGLIIILVITTLSSVLTSLNDEITVIPRQ